MRKKNQPIEAGRRTFLRAVALGGGAASVLAGTGLSFAAVDERIPATQTIPQQEHSSGYHETEHIREYYRKAAF